MTLNAKIYDVTFLEIVKRLEVALYDMGITEDKPLGDKIRLFGEKRPQDKEILRLMNKIKEKRNQIVHPAALKSIVDSSTEPQPVIFTLREFNDYRGDCVKLSKLLAAPPFNCISGMDEIMIPTLPYDMGNAGDIIKHGLLAEFCAWWFETHMKLVFIDGFGGCPWGDYKRVKDRIDKLQNTTLGVALEVPENKGKYPKYFGSAHLVKRITPTFGKRKKADVYVFDTNADAQSNLENSGLKILPCGSGYRVFDKQEEYNFNLIMIDPFAEFLRDECYKGNAIFNRIYKHVNDHENVYVALFVLDMMDNHVHRNFCDFKNNKLKDIAVSLRCPKILKQHTTLSGESGYNSEILLISKQIKNNPNIGNLKYRLKKFAEHATKALPLHGKKIEFWPNEENK